MTTRHLALTLLTLLIPLAVKAEYTLNYKAETTVNAGNGTFAPYYIASKTDGMITQARGVMETASIWRPLQGNRRFDYSFGLTAAAGWASSAEYDRYDIVNNSWSLNNQHPPYAWIQELYGEVRYRSLFLSLGMKNYDRSYFDDDLGTGDLTLSNNTRPIPQLRAGFHDFVDIPLTKGWVQIQGEIAYGKFMDSKWLENHFNYYNHVLATGGWFHYARAYFRTNPTKPFHFTLGLQEAGQFGGLHRIYENGNIYREISEKVNLWDFFRMLIPTDGVYGASEGDAQFVYGNHLGTLDVAATYRFADSSELTAFAQWPWEDGSGLGKLNGWDGRWVLKYKPANFKWIEEAQVEYLDFMNQSGPIHWAPGDFPGTTITSNASGADDYYNNYNYSGWQYYGMSLGTAFFKSPIYNTNGVMMFLDNRLRGFQIGLKGSPTESLSYRFLVSYRESRGTPMRPRAEILTDTSLLAECIYRFPRINGLRLKAQFAFDAGKLYGNNFGILASLEYSGLIKF